VPGTPAPRECPVGRQGWVAARPQNMALACKEQEKYRRAVVYRLLSLAASVHPGSSRNRTRRGLHRRAATRFRTRSACITQLPIMFIVDTIYPLSTRKARSTARARAARETIPEIKYLVRAAFRSGQIRDTTCLREAPAVFIARRGRSAKGTHPIELPRNSSLSNSLSSPNSFGRSP
jgi:hypothetical protein